MTSLTRDVVIVGSGIVGAAVAAELAGRGRDVLVLESGELAGGATAEGMGHVLFLDDHPEQSELLRVSLERWRSLQEELPNDAEVDVCGTLWVATDDEELQGAERKAEALGSQGIECELISPRQLRNLEPALSSSVQGALRLPKDSVVYPPNVARHLLKFDTRGSGCRSAGRIETQLGVQVVGVSADVSGAGGGAGARAGTRAGAVEVRLRDAPSILARDVVVAAGIATPELLPDCLVLPRKGHLAITDRYPGLLHHQIVELGYVKNAHAGEGDSVSFNVQPRPTGQLLLGSSRQFAGRDRFVDPSLVSRLMKRILEFLPALDRARILRIWTGFRPATPDDRPLIGRWQGDGVWVATGHEGLGITTSLGTAELLADLMDGRSPRIQPDVFDPCRVWRATS